MINKCIYNQALFFETRLSTTEETHQRSQNIEFAG